MTSSRYTRLMAHELPAEEQWPPIHYIPEDGAVAEPRSNPPLCVRGGATPPEIGDWYTRVPDKVTCSDCLEWMHA